ncbi:FtsX-like permease family protein, partial [bacterium]|nr:FtsX-like permease family protein [bacterium]
MTKFLSLAWRNIWRNKRRTMITVSAIAFAILMVAITRSLQYGTYDIMESLAVRLYNGEVQMHEKGFHEEQSLNLSLHEDTENWQKLIDAHPKLTIYSRRITSFGLVSSDSASAGALVVGIEPLSEQAITMFSRLVKKGEMLGAEDDHRVLIGSSLARNLQVDVGDSVAVLTQGYRNQLGADLYRVWGIVTVGHAELDRGIMIMPLHNAQELFSLQGRVTQVVFGMSDFRKAQEASKALAAGISNRDLEILSWEEMMPELKQIIVIDNVSGAIYLAFILIVVGMEILNATMMSVIERTHEFGILQSMGMKPRQITGLIFAESVLKILVALSVGFVISLGVVSLLTQYTIPLPTELKEAYAT